MSFVERVKARLKRDAQSKKRLSSSLSTTLASTPPNTSVSDLHETPRILPDATWETEDRNADSKPSPAKPAHSPISSVWSEAWDELLMNPETAVLARRYESLLLESAATSVPSGTVLLYGKHEQLRFLIERQTEKIEKNEWKVRFRGYDFKVKALVEPAIAITQSAKGFIGSAVEASPPASLAWAGLCLLLPLVLNPSDGEEARVKGLEYLSSVLRQCKLREYVYQRRYESVTGEAMQQDFEQAHLSYRESLRALYARVLVFEMTCCVFLAGGTSKRLAKGIANWDDWSTLINAVKAQQAVVTQIEDNWRDLRLQEEWEVHQREHHQRVSALNSVSLELSRMKGLIQDQQNQKDRSDLLRWLSSVADPSTNYAAARAKHTKDTGAWILKDERFHRWCSADNSFIWLHGKAGSGKSFLSSTVINHLQNERDSEVADEVYNAVAYFYFDFRDSSKQTRNSMLRSLIAQICQGRPDFPESLRRLSKFPNTNQSPSTEELQKALLSTIQDFANVYIVLDALDECPQEGDERDLLMQCIQEMRGWKVPHLHLLMTSRREHDIALYLSINGYCDNEVSVPEFSAEISLEACSSEMSSDIEAYVNAQLSSKPKFGHWKPDLQRRVCLTLIEKADGMFQYVAIQLDILRRTKMTMIEAALQDLPDDINKVYERALQQSPDPDVTMRVLTWLAFTDDNVKLGELAFYARLKPVYDDSDSEDSPEVMKLYDEDLEVSGPEDILRWLPSLVTVHHEKWEDPYTDINDRYYVRICHFSLLEFLTSEHADKPWRIDLSEARIFLAQTSVATFVYSATNTPFFPQWQDIGRNDVGFEFLSIVSYFKLLPRALEQTRTNRLAQLLRKLYEPDSRPLGWLEYWQVQNLSKPRAGLMPLQVLFRIGETPAMLMVLRLMPEVVNMTENRSSDTALSLAAESGDEMLVKVLLEAKADQFINDNPRDLPLRICFRRNNRLTINSRLRCARLLLDAGGPDVVRRFIESSGRSPLNLLTTSDWVPEQSPQIAEILVERGSDLNSALESTIRSQDYGTLEAMIWLLDRGAAINSSAMHTAERELLTYYINIRECGRGLYSYEPDPDWDEVTVVSDRSPRYRGVESSHGPIYYMQVLLSRGGQIPQDDPQEWKFELLPVQRAEEGTPLINPVDSLRHWRIYDECTESLWGMILMRTFRGLFRAKSCNGTYVNCPAEAYEDFQRWTQIVKWAVSERQTEWPPEVPPPSEADMDLFEQWWERGRRGGWGPQREERRMMERTYY